MSCRDSLALNSFEPCSVICYKRRVISPLEGDKPSTLLEWFYLLHSPAVSMLDWRLQRPSRSRAGTSSCLTRVRRSRRSRRWQWRHARRTTRTKTVYCSSSRRSLCCPVITFRCQWRRGESAIHLFTHTKTLTEKYTTVVVNLKTFDTSLRCFRPADFATGSYWLTCWSGSRCRVGSSSHATHTWRWWAC